MAYRRRKGAGAGGDGRTKKKDGTPPVWLPGTEAQGPGSMRKVSEDLASGRFTFEVTLKQPLDFQMQQTSWGVVVSSVSPGGNVEACGIRAGDRVIATSATLGDQLWEKATMEGVASAIRTRFVLCDTVTLRLERGLRTQEIAAARFREAVTQAETVTLRKPLGLELERRVDPATGESLGAFVRAVEPGLAAFESGRVRVGDRIAAVSSTLGGRMWEYKSLEGVVSALNSPLKDTVTLRVERRAALGSWEDGGLAAIGATLEQYRLLNAAAAAPTSKSSAISGAVFGASAKGALAGAAAAEAATAAATGKSAAGAAGDSGMTVASERRRCGTTDGAGRGGTIDGAAVAAIVVLERCRTLVKACGEAGEISALDNLLREMRNAGVAVDARFCNAAMTAALRCGRPDRALQLYEAATGDQQALEEASRSAAARGAASRSKIRGGRSSRTRSGAAAGADASGGNSGSHSSSGGSRSDAAAVAGASDGGSSGGGSSSSGGGSSSSGGGSSSAGGSNSEPYLLLTTEGQGGILPNVKLLTTLVSAYGAAGRLDRAFAVVEETARQNNPDTAPDTALLNALAQACVRSGDPGRAERVYSELMPQYGVQADAQTFNIVINGYARARRPREALRAFQGMLAAGMEPNRITMTVVIKAHLKQGDTTAALAVLAAMGRQGMKADAATFNTVIHGLMRRLHWEQAWAVFCAMKDAGVRPSLMTYSYLMSGFTRCGYPERAIDLFEELRAGTGTGAAARARGAGASLSRDSFGGAEAGGRVREVGGGGAGDGVWNDVRDSAGSGAWDDGGSSAGDGGWDDGSGSAWDNGDDATTERGAMPWEHENGWGGEELPVSFNGNAAAAAASTAGGSLGLASVPLTGGGTREEVIGSWVARRKDPAAAAAPPADPLEELPVGGFVGPSDAAVAGGLRSGNGGQAVGGGIKPNVEVYTILVNAYAKRGSVVGAMQTLRDMRADGVKPNARTLTAVVEACVNDNQPDVALAVFAEAKKAGVAADVVLNTLLIRAYALKGELGKGLALLDAMERAGAKAAAAGVLTGKAHEGDSDRGNEEDEEESAAGSPLAVAARQQQRGPRRDGTGSGGGSGSSGGAGSSSGRERKGGGGGGAPNIVTYNSLLLACVQRADWGMARRVVERLLRTGGRLTPNGRFFEAAAVVPDSYDTADKDYPRLNFLLFVKAKVRERSWRYSSALYIAILEEAAARFEYELAYLTMNDRAEGAVYTRAGDADVLDAWESKIEARVVGRGAGGRYEGFDQVDKSGRRILPSKRWR